jgi:glycosyltransferase involved in cell wall biosynthesis
VHVDFYLADQNPHRDRSLGITAYTSGLLEALARVDGLTLSALVSRSSFSPPAGVAIRSLPIRTDYPAGRLLADHVLGPLFRAPPAANLIHFPKGFLPISGRARCPRVGTVHDTIVVHYARAHAGYRPLRSDEYWCFLLARSLARLDLVLTDSEFSRRAIAAFCEERTIAPPRIIVTFLGARWEDLASRQAPAATKGSYVIHLASQLPHKNTLALLRLWESYAKRGNDHPELLLVGSLTPPAEHLARALPRVRLEPRVTTDRLQQLIEGALLLVLPSEIEGFGLPALEAYYLSTPVVYVFGTAVEEILGTGSPGGFALDDVDSFIAAVDQVLGLDARWVTAKASELRGLYAWSRCAERTLEAYRSVG